MRSTDSQGRRSGTGASKQAVACVTLEIQTNAIGGGRYLDQFGFEGDEPATTDRRAKRSTAMPSSSRDTVEADRATCASWNARRSGCRDGSDGTSRPQDQALQEGLLRLGGLEPDGFPVLVGLEEMRRHDSSVGLRGVRLRSSRAYAVKPTKQKGKDAVRDRASGDQAGVRWGALK